MTFNELFEKVGSLISASNSIFPLFLKDFREFYRNETQNPDWPEKCQLGDSYIYAIWDLATAKLFDIAVSFANETDDPVYSQATEIADALRTAILSEFGMTLAKATIQSPARMMEAAGFLKISDCPGPDNQKQVQLTPMGAQAAKTLDDLIKAIRKLIKAIRKQNAK